MLALFKYKESLSNNLFFFYYCVNSAFNATSLSPNTSYIIKVVVADNAGNSSNNELTIKLEHTHSWTVTSRNCRWCPSGCTKTEKCTICGATRTTQFTAQEHVPYVLHTGWEAQYLRYGFRCELCNAYWSGRYDVFS